MTDEYRDPSSEREADEFEPSVPFGSDVVDAASIVEHFLDDDSAERDLPEAGQIAAWQRQPPFTGGARHVADRPAWHFQTDTQEEAIARLLYVAEKSRPTGVLVGAAGSGKTHVLAMVASELRRAGGSVLTLDLSGMDSEGLIDQASARIGCVSSDSDAPMVRLRMLSRWMEGQLAAGGLTVLADHLDQADRSALLVLDRLLSACEGGIPTLLAATETAECEMPVWVRRHGGLRIGLETMTPDQTAAYLDAGLAEAEPVGLSPRFTPEAAARVHELSGGRMRSVGAIGRMAFVAGRAERFGSLTVELVEAACQELAMAS